MLDPFFTCILITSLVNIVNSQQLIISNTITSAEQVQSLKQSINGRTLNGPWQCIQQLFYQPSECQFFPIPVETLSMVSIINYLQPTPFFKQTNQGIIEGFFYSSDENTLTDKLYLLLYRQKYTTGQVIQMDIDLVKAQKFITQNQNNHTKLVLYRQQGLITTATLYQNQQTIVKYDITLNVEVFIDSEDYQSFNQVTSTHIPTPIHIRVFSSNISFAASLSSPSYTYILYTLLFLCFLQSIFIFISPTSQNNASRSRTVMFRISQWFLLQMYCFIIIFSKEYIKLGLKYYDTQLGYLIYLGLGNIGIGLLFLKKYQMVLEKFTNKRTLLYAVVFFCSYWYIASKYFHYAFFWVIEITIMMQLQVIYSMANGGKGGLPYDLVGFMIASRLPMIYMQLYSNNIFNTPPINTSYIELLSIVFLFHCLIIYIQSLKGGQFIIPNSIIPGYYNYFFTYKSDHQKVKEDCPICTTPLNQSPDTMVQVTEVEGSSIHSIQSNLSREEVQVMTKTQVQDTINKMVRLMRTPCGHIFHIDCLTRWMHAKLVCPYCRSTLPQLASIEKE